MTPPILLPGILKEKDLILTLRRLKLKTSDIKSIHYADNATLIFLKKRVKNKPKKELIPSRKTEAKMLRVEAFVEEYRYLIAQERTAEIEAQIREIKTLSAHERELFGRAVLHLKGKYLGSEFYYHLVRFSRDKRIETEIANGDIVLVSQGNPLQSDLTGTVFEIRRHFITVAFENAPPRWALSRDIRIDLYINDITFKRMEENLLELLHARGRQKKVRNIILGLEAPETAIPVPFTPKDNRLNFSQKEAVSKALGSKTFFLIHGPPGTGKTSTLIELILQSVTRKQKVLATADSNTAVDNMLMRLAKHKCKIVRIGHPVRIATELHKYSIHYLFEQHAAAKSLKEAWQEIKEMAQQRDLHAKPTAARSRGMSQERILSLVYKGKNQRGISKETLQSMALWIKANRKIEAKANDLRDKEAQIYRQIIEEADIVLATNSMAKSDMLADTWFDLAVIDEGSQQMIPSTLIPILKADRFVIAGDHKQLPPTIISNHPKLRETLFEALIEKHPKLSKMLQVQYRMHEKIMKFSNEHFYKGKLIADKSVRGHTLADLGLHESQKFPKILALSSPLTFVDMHKTDAKEAQNERSTSYYNEAEAKLCVDLARELLQMGAKPEDIGIITPYAAQIKMIKQLLEHHELPIETKTVDGFQGQEREIIIISFVRANEKGEIGFLKDARRLNVAVTRARRKLICIGDAGTLRHDKLFAEFLGFMEDEGDYLHPSNTPPQTPL